MKAQQATVYLMHGGKSVAPSHFLGAPLEMFQSKFSVFSEVPFTKEETPCPSKTKISGLAMILYK